MKTLSMELRSFYSLLIILAIYPAFLIVSVYSSNHSSILTSVFIIGFIPALLHFGCRLVACASNKENNKELFFYIIFFIFMLLYFYVVFLNYSIDPKTKIFDRHLAPLVYFPVVFAAAANVNFEKHKHFFYYSLIVVLIVLLLDYNISSALSAVEDKLGYQQKARTLLFLALVTICSVKSKLSLIAIFLMSSVVLFLVGSRSEFATLIFVAALGIVFFSKSKVTAAIYLLYFSIIIFCLVIFFGESLSDSRIFELLSLNESSSFQARNSISKLSLEIIADNPVLGSYGYYYSSVNSSYAHNLLSVWVDLGIVGLLLLGFLLVFSLFSSLRILKKSNACISKLSFLVSSATIFLLIFSKDFTVFLVPLSFGIAINNMKLYRKDRRVYIAASEGDSQHMAHTT